MNQKPVDDKDEVMEILTNGGFIPYGPNLVKAKAQLDAHYQKKYLGLIGEDDEISVRELSRDKSFEDAMSLSEENQSRNTLRAELREALAKMEGE